MIELTSEQQSRYARNIQVSGIGIEGQQKLLTSRVLILGCGALGSVVGAYLAGAGVGALTLVDFDTVDVSNLQRQFLFRERDAGRSKARMLAERLSERNSGVDIRVEERRIETSDARTLFPGHDFIVEATDNADTKYMVDSVCAELGLPYALGGVSEMRGQLMTHVPGSAHYVDFFPESGAGEPACMVRGVIGPMPGMVGSMLALEAIKFLTGSGRLLTDRLLVIDGRTMQFVELKME